MSIYRGGSTDEYDGPSSLQIARERNARRRNDMLDCRDPDHEGCAVCEPENFEEEDDE